MACHLVRDCATREAEDEKVNTKAVPIATAFFIVSRAGVFIRPPFVTGRVGLGLVTVEGNFVPTKNGSAIQVLIHFRSPPLRRERRQSRARAERLFPTESLWL